MSYVLLPDRTYKNHDKSQDTSRRQGWNHVLLSVNKTKVGVDIKTYTSNDPNERRNFRNVRWLTTSKRTVEDSVLDRSSDSSSIAQVGVILGGTVSGDVTWGLQR